MKLLPAAIFWRLDGKARLIGSFYDLRQMNKYAETVRSVRNAIVATRTMAICVIALNMAHTILVMNDLAASGLILDSLIRLVIWGAYAFHVHDYILNPGRRIRSDNTVLIAFWIRTLILNVINALVVAALIIAIVALSKTGLFTVTRGGIVPVVLLVALASVLLVFTFLGTLLSATAAGGDRSVAAAFRCGKETRFDTVSIVFVMVVVFLGLLLGYAIVTALLSLIFNSILGAEIWAVLSQTSLAASLAVIRLLVATLSTVILSRAYRACESEPGHAAVFR